MSIRIYTITYYCIRMDDEMQVINCGERRVQTLSRIAIQDICQAHNITVGDRVEVWIKKICATSVTE